MQLTFLSRLVRLLRRVRHQNGVTEDVPDRDNDILEVIVHQKLHAPDDCGFIQVMSGGEIAEFVPGQITNLKRKFVEQLARTTQMVDGRLSLLYPFTVLKDPRPDIGRERLARILGIPA